MKRVTLTPVVLKRRVPVLAQLIGLVVLATGFGLLAVWAGLVVGGLGLVVVGVVAEFTEHEEHEAT